MDSSITGSYRYDEELGRLVKYSDEIPNLNRFQIFGSRPYCAPGGETLDFGSGPTFVKNASEKCKLMKAHGVAEHQGKLDRPKYDPSKVPSFREHFKKEHGTSLEEAAPSMIHLKEG